MFNLVMGIIMIGIGTICLVKGCVGTLSPVMIFFGCCMIVFGIVEIIRSKAIRKREQQRKDHEMDVYLKMAEEMGVVVNPITHEIVKKRTINLKTDELVDGYTYYYARRLHSILM